MLHFRAVLLVLAAVVGLSAFFHGGVLADQWNVAIAALGTLGLLCAAFLWHRAGFSTFDRAVATLLALFVVYIAFQLAPLPSEILSVISPRRATHLQELEALGFKTSVSPLSLFPSVTFVHLLRVCAAIAVFLLIARIAASDRKASWRLVAPIVAIAALEASLGLAQVHLQQEIRPARGTYVNNNHFSGLLEMALPFAVIYPVALIRRNRRSWDIPIKTAVVASLVAAVAALIFSGILFSLSRMGFVSSLFSLAFMALLAPVVRMVGTATGSRTRLALVIMSIVAALLVCVLALPTDTLIGRFAQLAATETISQEGRLALWEESWELVGEYPLFGVGLGAYHSAYIKHKVSAPLLDDDYAHNDYLQLLVELGATGFAIVAAVVFLVFSNALAAAHANTGSDSRLFALACAGSLAAILLHSCADFNLYIPANVLCFSWILALSAKVGLPSRTSSASNSRLFRRDETIRDDSP
ncbi:MAG TPA: O-antigen ligase family protein [Pirellulaceae bacterium]|nr:O-antigen ligase family protein [Pirellulaceae bacterium]